MKNFKYLKNKNEVISVINGLGDFIYVSINDKYINEIDLVSPCGFDRVTYILNKYVYKSKFSKATVSDGAVTLILENGDIIEFSKSLKVYLTKEEVLKKVEELSNKGRLVIKTIVRHAITKNQEEYMNIIDIKSLIEEVFNNGKFKIKKKSFMVDNNKISFLGPLVSSNMTYSQYVITTKEELLKLENRKKNTRIIQSNKFKRHMEIHTDQFLVPYKNLIKYMELKGKLKELKGEFIEMVIEFPFDIGYSKLCKIDSKDRIVYAKRKKRNIYSKFTLDGKKKLINKCVVVLKQSYTKPDEYYLITMFPGEYTIKEPQDQNIKTEEEKRRTLEFWENHAFVYNPKDIVLETLTYKCPYKYTA